MPTVRRPKGVTQKAEIRKWISSKRTASMLRRRMKTLREKPNSGNVADKSVNDLGKELNKRTKTQKAKEQIDRCAKYKDPKKGFSKAIKIAIEIGSSTLVMAYVLSIFAKKADTVVAEEKARKEAEEKARKEAEEKARKEAEEKTYPSDTFAHILNALPMALNALPMEKRIFINKQQYENAKPILCRLTKDRSQLVDEKGQCVTTANSRQFVRVRVYHYYGPHYAVARIIKIENNHKLVLEPNSMWKDWIAMYKRPDAHLHPRVFLHYERRRKHCRGY